MSSVVRYRMRDTGEVVTERVFGGDTLDTLYGTRHGRLFTERVLTSATANHLYGWLKRRAWSRRDIPGFIESLGIDATEAERPVASYATLDEFFCRKLRSGARPIDTTERVLVAPSDGRALVYPQLDGTALRVKASRVRLPELLGDPLLASAFEGGSAVVVRLAPADYHRFHFPESGRAGAPHAIAGPLHSVHPIALAAGAPSFLNKRTITHLETGAFGELLVIEVGALCVGTIVQTYAPGEVRRGEEKGLFRFGGSTVIVLAPRGRLVFDDDLLETSRTGLETFVKMGTRVGVAAR